MSLRDEIEAALNRHSAENGSNTPDFVLADYLMDCLAAFDKAVMARGAYIMSDEGDLFGQNGLTFADNDGVVIVDIFDRCDSSDPQPNG